MGSETFEGKSLSLLKLLRPLPFWLRFDVLPWVVGYPVCLGWLVMEWEGGSDLDLLRLSILALAVLSHALMFLLCYWLVGLQALVRYKNVGLPTSSSVPTHAYCVPAQRRGPSAIVPIIPKGLFLSFLPSPPLFILFPLLPPPLSSPLPLYSPPSLCFGSQFNNVSFSYPQKIPRRCPLVLLPRKEVCLRT